VREKNYNCVRELRELSARKTTLIETIEVLAGEQLCAYGSQMRGLRLRRALSGRTGRVDNRKPPSH